MTREEFFAVARAKGWVRWTRSGIIERLIYINNEHPHVIAEGLVTQPHTVRPSNRGVIECEEVDAKVLISMGELIDSWEKAPRHLRKSWRGRKK